MHPGMELNVCSPEVRAVIGNTPKVELDLLRVVQFYRKIQRHKLIIEDTFLE